VRAFGVVMVRCTFLDGLHAGDKSSDIAVGWKCHRKFGAYAQETEMRGGTT